MTSNHAVDTPEWEPRQLRNAIKAAGVALWTWNVDDDTFLMDAKGFELWDLSDDHLLTFESLSGKIHPADRDRVRAAFVATRAIVGPYEIDFRILTEASDVRWISARGQGDDAGIKQLTQRLTALGRAHDLVRPLPGGQGSAALLGDLFTVLLAPYDDAGAFAGRIRIAVPRVGVGEAAATNLALVIHELATNSLKYGSLSVATGTLDVSGNMAGDDVEFVWTEQGGPEVDPPEGTGGYGSKLLRRTVDGPLAGSIAYEWTRSGVLVTLRIKGARLSK